MTFHVDTSWSSEMLEFVSEIRNDLPINSGSSTDALKLMKLVEKVYECER